MDAGLRAQERRSVHRLVPAFTQLAPAEIERMYLPDDHYTDAGNRFVAEKLLVQLAGMVPGFPSCARARCHELDPGASLRHCRRAPGNGAGGGSAVVAFVATWNRRCQGFAPGYAAFAARWGTALPVVCVDVDECTALTATFDVCSVPTILLLRAGAELYREAGLDLAAVSASLARNGYGAE